MPATCSCPETVHDFSQLCDCCQEAHHAHMIETACDATDAFSEDELEDYADGEPTEADEWEDYYGGDNGDHGMYDGGEHGLEW